MDRESWLAARRSAVVAEYDADAPMYDQHGYPTDMQEQWVARLLRMLQPRGIVLDAPCGTGRYFPMINDSGLRVAGIDQSAQMLAQARARGIAVRLEQQALQTLSYDAEFDAVLTIDAMENVPPEDWPAVAANLCRAVRSGGLIYLTVEEVSDARIDEEFELLAAAGIPAVRGEVVGGDVAGYHYYPGRERAIRWLTSAGLAILEEDYRQEDGWGYRHFLLRRGDERC
jgi:SAM-dependent methyltransferase